MTFVPSVWMTTMVDRFEILGVRAADGGARLILQLECDVGGEVSRESLTVLTTRMKNVPQKGLCDEEAVLFLRREHALCAALAIGIRSLASGGCSQLQLRHRLCQKGVARDVAEDTVRALCEKGYLLREQKGQTMRKIAKQ